MRRIGQAWRTSAADGGDAPAEVQEWWGKISDQGAIEVAELGGTEAVCSALLQVCASADEASHGVGLPRPEDEFETIAWLFLEDRGTLAANVDPSIVRVLPKCHTPQVGMTIRSLSHHLSLCPAGDVEPKWYLFEQQRADKNLNLLLVPWPRTLLPGDFKQAEGPLHNMNQGEFGFFTYECRQRLTPQHVAKWLDRAKELVERVDGVILPEQAVSRKDYQALKRLVVDQRKVFLMAGVGEPAKDGDFGVNEVHFDAPLRIANSDNQAVVEPQAKHHRWQLSGGQIGQYGLGRNLDPKKKWWECISVSRRQLSFVALEPWLTLSVLICEDLARQDPVAEIVRSVGPNLVIALLLDGPQLAERWSARYATVLADDPGTSVLTLTSVGMVDLCRGPRRVLESRPVALWKDALTGGPYELNLPADADALLLCLAAEYKEEWSADGRTDAERGRTGDGTTSYLTLQCVHAIAGSS